jgi:hypothetical protein
MSELDVRTQVSSSAHSKQGPISLHPRSRSDDDPEVIDLASGIDHAVSELSGSLGMVANLELRDGDIVCGVLGAVNSDVFILEHWDNLSDGPNGDPFTVSVHQVRRVVIP